MLDRELNKYTAFFAWLRLTLGKPGSFSITCWGCSSAVGGKILNIAAGFFGARRLPDPDCPGYGWHIFFYIFLLKGVYENRAIYRDSPRLPWTPFSKGGNLAKFL
jgi:hypothetical protein